MEYGEEVVVEGESDEEDYNLEENNEESEDLPTYQLYASIS